MEHLMDKMTEMLYQEGLITVGEGLAMKACVLFTKKELEESEEKKAAFIKEYGVLTYKYIE